MAQSRNALVYMVRNYFEQDVARAASCLETMEEDEAAEVLSALPAEKVGEIFTRLEPNSAANLMQSLPQDTLKQAVDQLDPSQCAAILIKLPAEIRKRLIDEMPANMRQDVQEILTYPENSAGRIMSSDVLAFHADVKVQDAIQRIRLLARKKMPTSYAYVVDKENRLVGVMNMRDLMLAPEEARLESILTKQSLFAVNCFMDREQVAEELSNRRFFAAPVVDNENRLLGVVRAENLLEDVQEEATEDIQKMFGAGGDERPFSPIRFSLAKRLPWLHVNLATAFLAGSVVAIFKDVVAQFPILAVYLPVVAGQGGNAGAQSLVIVIRGLVMQEIPPRKVWRLVSKEVAIGIFNGIVMGLVTAGAAVLWHGNPYLGLVVGLAMLVNLMVAGLTGAAIPLVMKSFRLDPAQCSNIILTTFTDVMGFFSLLGFAVLFEKFLR